jgi:antitoxin CptB
LLVRGPTPASALTGANSGNRISGRTGNGSPGLASQGPSVYILSRAGEPQRMPDAMELDDCAVRRRRLRFRSWHRGTRDADLLLGPFADGHLDRFSPVQLDRYEALLEMSDPDLYNWITGREPVPAGYVTDVLILLRNFVLRT